MSGKSRILLFSTAFRPFVGGSELAVENIAHRLPEISFDIITPRFFKRLPKFEAQGNIWLYRVGRGTKWDKYLLPILGFFKGLKLIKRYPYQKIHAYQASFGAGAAWLLKLFAPKLEFILTIQEGENLENQNWLVKLFRKLIIRKADVITTISTYLIDYVRKINPRAQHWLVPNGVAMEEFLEVDSKVETLEKNLREQLKIKNDNRVVITISRLVPKNGLDILIKAVALVKKEIPELKLFIIGRGTEAKRLEAMIESLDLKETVTMLGELAHENIAGFLILADIFARPSRSEGLGSAFLEAMAAGVPVIGTPVGGIPDFLKDGQTGLFCQPGDAVDLAEKIIRLLTNHRLRSKLAVNAKNLVIQHYTWDKIAGQFSKIYA